MNIEMPESRVRLVINITLCFYSLLFLSRSLLGNAPTGNVPNLILFSCFAALTLPHIRPSKISIFFLISLLALPTITVIMGVSLSNYKLSELIGDFSTSLRGPFLGVWVFIVAAIYIDRNLMQRIFQYTWTLTSLAIILSGLLKIGINTYDYHQIGWKFYFVSNNELTFTYTLISGLYALYAAPKKFPLILSVCIITLLTIGTKAGFIGLILLIAVYLSSLLRSFGSYFYIGFILFCTIMTPFLIMTINLEDLLRSLLPIFSISAGFEKIVERISYAGFWEGILSGRGRFALFAISEFLGSSSIFEYLFGIGFADTKRQFAIEFGRESFIEIDSLDLLLSFGIFGLALYSTALASMLHFWVKLSSIDRTASNMVLFTALMILTLGNLSGHVIFSSWSMATCGLCIGALVNSFRNKSV